MENCKNCGVAKHPDSFINGLCFSCRALEKRGVSATERFVRSDYKETGNILLTTETNTNFIITKRIEIISAECAFGMNIFKDFFAGVRDVFGGRSKSIQNTLRDARKTVLNELKSEAKKVGANAVIAVDLDYSEISGGGKSMLFLVATGTAVIIDLNETTALTPS